MASKGKKDESSESNNFIYACFNCHTIDIDNTHIWEKCQHAFCKSCAKKLLYAQMNGLKPEDTPIVHRLHCPQCEQPIGSKEVLDIILGPNLLTKGAKERLSSARSFADVIQLNKPTSSMETIPTDTSFETSSSFETLRPDTSEACTSSSQTSNTTESSSKSSIGKACAKCSAPLQKGKSWAELEKPPCPKHTTVCTACIVEELERAVGSNDVAGCPACEESVALLRDTDMEALTALPDTTLQMLLRDFTIGVPVLHITGPFFLTGPGAIERFRVRPDVRFHDFLAALLDTFRLTLVRPIDVKLYQGKDKKENSSLTPEEKDFPFDEIPIKSLNKDATMKDAAIKNNAILLLDVSQLDNTKKPKDGSEQKPDNSFMTSTTNQSQTPVPNQ